MRDSKHNFIAFLWHALFLAFVTTFIDVNTVFSSLILKIGGTSVHVGNTYHFFKSLFFKTHPVQTID